jgi:hypothetical protein
MRSMLIIFTLSALLNSCYHGTSGQTFTEDTETDNYSDSDSLNDAQHDMNEYLEVIDRQEISEVIEEEPSGEDEVCEPAVLVFQPVSLVGLITLMDCEEAGIHEVRVLLFQGTDLVLDSILPCPGDTIIVGPVAPESYNLAAVAGELFVVGVDLLRVVFPDVPSCDPDYVACSPLTVSVAPCGITIVPLTLYCDESFAPCYDCCNGG